MPATEGPIFRRSIFEEEISPTASTQPTPFGFNYHQNGASFDPNASGNGITSRTSSTTSPRSSLPNNNQNASSPSSPQANYTYSQTGMSPIRGNSAPRGSGVAAVSAGGRRNSSLNSLMNASNPLSSFYSQPRTRHSAQQRRILQRTQSGGVLAETAEEDEEESGSVSSASTSEKSEKKGPEVTAIEVNPDPAHDTPTTVHNEKQQAHTFHLAGVTPLRANPLSQTAITSAIPAPLSSRPSYPLTSPIDMRLIESSVWPSRLDLEEKAFEIRKESSARRWRCRPLAKLYYLGSGTGNKGWKMRMFMALLGFAMLVGVAVTLGLVLGSLSQKKHDGKSKWGDDA